MKRLSLLAVLAIAISAQAAAPAKQVLLDTKLAEASRSIKNPTDWLSLSADLRLRTIYMQNPVFLNKDRTGHEWNWQRYRARLGAQIRPIQDSSLEFNIRAVWEYRNYCKPESKGETHNDEVIFDMFNLKWTMPVGDAKLTATLGRQDIKKADGWLIFDGTPLDGTRTMYFDAARLQFELPGKKSLDLMYIYQTPNGKWLPRISKQDRYLTSEQVEQGIVAWYTDKNKPLGFLDQADAYFIYKQDQAVKSNGNDADIYTFGTAGLKHFDKNWSLRLELAGQFGRKNGARLCALGSNNRMTYNCNDANNTKFHLEYAYRSGDNPNTKENEGFDTLWGRFAHISEIYLYTMAGESRLADYSNLHRLGLKWETSCGKNLRLRGGYQLLFAPRNTYQGRPGFSSNGNFRGQLVQGRADYTFNEHVSCHLMCEFFAPGNYYDDTRNDPGLMVRYEIMFKL